MMVETGQETERTVEHSWNGAARNTKIDPLTHGGAARETQFYWQFVSCQKFIEYDIVFTRGDNECKPFKRNPKLSEREKQKLPRC